MDQALSVKLDGLGGILAVSHVAALDTDFPFILC